ncbi:MAG: type II toxin-antitoxin system HigB family toxin [Desulfomonilaceae bacterium]|nr:type II toxin-antitoxin system HigB family toxin [Desulfomonilaceae bacterium]
MPGGIDERRVKRVHIRREIDTRIISRAMLRDYWSKHPDAEGRLRNWEDKTKRAHWRRAQDVVDDYPKASPIGEDRIYFRLGPLRLVVAIAYDKGTVYTRWVGNKKEVKKIDTLTV